MRIQINGTNATAVGLRGLLQSTGRYVLTDHGPHYVISIREEMGIGDIILDGVDSALEGRIVSRIAELALYGRVLLQRGGGNQDDRAMVIRLPAKDDKASKAVELGVFRALEQLQDPAPTSRLGRLKRWMGLAVLLIACSFQTPVRAQFFVNVVFQRTTFANLGTPADGRVVYCTDCAPATTPCTGASTGALAVRQSGGWVCIDGGGGGGGAPTDATYITQTANATLSQEQALSSLATGYMKVANGTGVVTSQAVPIPTASGGTELTAAADDNVMVGNGTLWQTKALTNCSGATSAVSYATATNTFGCNTITDPTHEILSATHSDTLAGTVVRGDIVYGNATPKWDRLPLGAFGGLLFSNAVDAVWATGNFICCVATANQTRSAITYADVTGLTFAGMPANLYFSFDCTGAYQSANVSEGFGFAINMTGGTAPAAVHYVVGAQTTANGTNSTDIMTEVGLTAFDGMTVTTTAVAAATNLALRIKGTIFTGTSGTATFAVRFRSETATAINITVMKGTSCVMARAI